MCMYVRYAFFGFNPSIRLWVEVIEVEIIDIGNDYQERFALLVSCRSLIERRRF